MAKDKAMMQEEKPEEMSPETQDMTPKQKAYVSGITKMLHSPQTSGKIVEMLRSAPPEKSIPQAALTVFNQYDGMISKKSGKQTPLEDKLLGGIFVVSDLAEIGNAAGIWERELTEEDFPGILQNTLQPYIQQGLKDGTIDPIELQAALEPMLSDEQRQQGLAAGEAAGIPQEAGQEQAMEMYAAKRERKALSKVADREAAQNRQGMLQGGA